MDNAYSNSRTYHGGTNIAGSNLVTPVDILITYLAIGSAFAMRSYFRNRHRSPLSRFRAVAIDLTFWLPRVLISFILRSARLPKVVAGHSSVSPHIDPVLKDGFLAVARTASERHALEDIVDRYCALRSALQTEVPHRGSQFEIFAIAGNQNSAAGTACLARKNFKKLQDHSEQTANVIVRLASRIQSDDRRPEEILNRLSIIFEAYGDVDALAKLNLVRYAEIPNFADISGASATPLSRTIGG